MAALYSVTLFLSAALLFWVQPMIAKMLLPWLGGAPAVWNTCMVFFQAALLGGYAYAHWTSSRLSLKTQIALHLPLLAVALLFLPMAFSEPPSALTANTSPAGWLLSRLVLAVGPPFFMVASTGPLLQRWFSRTGHPGAHDPYFLYSASNMGSLLALVGYPVVLEPWLRLRQQSLAWTFGFGLLTAGIGVCALFLWRQSSFSQAPEHGQSRSAARSGAEPFSEQDPIPLTVRRRAFWVLLAFVPSSLMLGVTTFFTTDIASIPLLWVIPLTLYLFTFVLVFARRNPLPLSWTTRILPFAALGLIYLMITRTTEPAWLLILIHLLFFFVAAMVCHGRMAADRPEPNHLTEFYLWMSVGGVLGGIFNALAAPHFFRDVIEYPLGVVLACLLLPTRPAKSAGPSWDWRNLILPATLGVGAALLVLAVPRLNIHSRVGSSLLVAGLPAVGVYASSKNAWRFGLSAGAVLFAGWNFQAPKGDLLFLERNFFGVSRVLSDPEEGLHRLIHGNTFHGRQFTDGTRCCQPLAYYHADGPFAQIAAVYDQHPASPRVGVIGLGSGTMAAYIRPDQEWTFYEIDPAIIRIAQNTNWFTFLGPCAGGPWKIVAGDARLQLRRAPDALYGLIVLDAFSSDAIPVHLLTREAVELYLSKLAPGGFLAFHISNRYLDLAPVLGNLAAATGLHCRCWSDQIVTEEERHAGKAPSRWAVMGRRTEDFGRIARLANWEDIQGTEPARAWSDDFSNILSVFQWN
jgi:hypothetical protein